MTHLLESLPQAEQVVGKTTYQQFLEKGEAIGMKKIITTILANNPQMSDEQIARLCGIEIQIIKELREKLQKID